MVLVPIEIIKRNKRGFTPPRTEWLKAVVDSYGKHCYDGFLVSRGIMEKDSIINFFSNISSEGTKVFFAYKIVLLELWLQRFIEGSQLS